jgi:hypothetical protein
MPLCVAAGWIAALQKTDSCVTGILFSCHFPVKQNTEQLLDRVDFSLHVKTDQ